MNLTQDQIETAIDSTREAQEAVEQLLQVVGQEYKHIEVLSETLEDLLDELETDLIETLKE